MALINCPECKREISGVAEKCPHCGFPIKDYFRSRPDNLSSRRAPVKTNSSAPQKNSGIAIAAMVCGIVSIFLGFIFIGIIPALVAFVLGVMAIIKNPKKIGMPVTGILTSIAGIIISVIAFAIFTNMLDKTANSVPYAETEEKEVGDSSGSKDDAADSDLTTNNLENTFQSKEEFIASCQEFDYKSIARNPNEYLGQNFTLNVKIFSSTSGAWYSDYDTYYKAYTDDGSETYFDYMIYLIDRQDVESEHYLNVLDGDIITVYGTFNGMVETENGITGESGKEVSLDIYYAELISE